MDDATLIQEPAIRLPMLVAPQPVPSEQSISSLPDGTPCTLVRVRKGTEHVLFCVPVPAP